MEHSAAIMEEAERTIDSAVAASDQIPSDSRKKRKVSPSASGDASHEATPDNRPGKKPKRDFKENSLRFGSRGRDSRGNNRGDKKGRMGRTEYFKSNVDKRRRVDETRIRPAKSANPDEGEGGDGQEVISLKDHPVYATLFPKDEIEAEGRRPKRKVAVLIGYSGTGYKGMQLSTTERTIEGDLFVAFVKAGAISKANADDPKKTNLVRCARTDKGVHAAGNMISLKLIIDDDDIVDKINSHLSPQIRVWGIERTIGSFSCYQACDSRWYEYLIPSHSFLPPHPSSWVARKCDEYAHEMDDYEAFQVRQEDVSSFWDSIEEEHIKPVIDSLDEDIRFDVVKALQGEEEAQAKAVRADADVKDDALIKGGASMENSSKDKPEGVNDSSETTESAAIVINDLDSVQSKADSQNGESEELIDSVLMERPNDKITEPGVDDTPAENPQQNESKSILPAATVDSTLFEKSAPSQRKSALTTEELDRVRRLREATRRLRNAYITAKRRYRIPQTRIDRIQDALNCYIGTKNFHNFTIQKTFKDPSSKRNIKSFVVNTTPILIGEGEESEKTEWLSLKVHGQSFMMHQIRKMVGMVALLVRCGSNLATMEHALSTADKYSIPKVPGLGLLLERPVFDSYNRIRASKHEREHLDFAKFDDAIEDFKRKEIYNRIFREEEESNQFSRFFNHVDNFKEPYFLFVTSKGHKATQEPATTNPEQNE